jgi:hypothetical protein
MVLCWLLLVGLFHCGNEASLHASMHEYGIKCLLLSAIKGMYSASIQAVYVMWLLIYGIKLLPVAPTPQIFRLFIFGILRFVVLSLTLEPCPT